MQVMQTLSLGFRLRRTGFRNLCDVDSTLHLISLQTSLHHQHPLVQIYPSRTRVFHLRYEPFGFFAIVFACKPVSMAWDKSLGGHCYELRMVYLIQTVLVFVLDVCIIAAPMPLVWNLHTGVGTKAAVAGMFLLGGLSVFMPSPNAFRKYPNWSDEIVFA